MTDNHSALPRDPAARPVPVRRFSRLDRMFSLLLSGLPALLAIMVLITAMTTPVQHSESGDEFTDWFFNAAFAAEHRANWQGVLHPARPGRWLPDSKYDRFDASIRQSQLFDLLMAESVRQRVEAEPDNPRLVWLMACSLPVAYNYYESSARKIINYLKEQDGKGLLDRAGLEYLAYQIYTLAPREETDQDWWKQSQFRCFDDAGGASRSGMAIEDYDELVALIRRIDNSELNSARQLELRFTQLLNNDRFDEAVSLLRRHRDIKADSSDVAMLNILGLTEPAELDAVTRAQLQFYGYSDWSNSVRLEPLKLQQAANRLLASGETEDIQLMHDFFWKAGGIGSPYQQLLSTGEMLSALPAAVLQDPDNREFRTARQDISAFTRNNWTPSSLSPLQQGMISFEYQLSGQRLGLYGPDPLNQDYFLSQPTREEKIDAYGPNAAEQFERIRNLDWTTLDLSAAKPDDFDDPAAETDSSST